MLIIGWLIIMSGMRVSYSCELHSCWSW